jgi:hypothetical protein
VTDRDKLIGEFRQVVGDIDPVLQRAEDYGRGMKAVGRLVKSQGAVMSETLSNNAMLWEERKGLRLALKDLQGQNRELLEVNLKLSRKVAELTEAIAKLEASGGDRWRALYEDARRTLVATLHDQLDEESLKERLGAMKRQNEQLLAEGVKPVPLPDGTAIAEHAANVGEKL